MSENTGKVGAELTEQELDRICVFCEGRFDASKCEAEINNICGFEKTIAELITARLAAQKEKILAALPKKGCNPHKEWHDGYNGYNFAIDTVKAAIEEATKC